MTTAMLAARSGSNMDHHDMIQHLIEMGPEGELTRAAECYAGSIARFGASGSTSMDFVDKYIFLITGLYNIVGYGNSSGRNGLKSLFFGIRAMPIKYISEILIVSRETARRRLENMKEMNLIDRIDNGYAVADWGAWSEMAEQVK